MQFSLLEKVCARQENKSVLLSTPLKYPVVLPNHQLCHCNVEWKTPILMSLVLTPLKKKIYIYFFI